MSLRVLLVVSCLLLLFQLISADLGFNNMNSGVSDTSKLEPNLRFPRSAFAQWGYPRRPYYRSYGNYAYYPQSYYSRSYYPRGYYGGNTYGRGFRRGVATAALAGTAVLGGALIGYGIAQGK